jgi:hypothetical protein
MPSRGKTKAPRKKTGVAPARTRSRGKSKPVSPRKTAVVAPCPPPYVSDGRGGCTCPPGTWEIVDISDPSKNRCVPKPRNMSQVVSLYRGGGCQLYLRIPMGDDFLELMKGAFGEN